MWIAMKLFGNGFGMGAPFFDQPFIWLVDTAKGPRRQKFGRFYSWIGGLGAQLGSFEWRRPAEGERRVLADETFILFNARRSRFALMWNCSWALDPHVEGMEQVRALKRRVFAVTP